MPDFLIYNLLALGAILHFNICFLWLLIGSLWFTYLGSCASFLIMLCYCVFIELDMVSLRMLTLLSVMTEPATLEYATSLLALLEPQLLG